MAKKKKDKTPMEELTKNYKKFINGKELNPDGAKQFEKVLKKPLKLKHLIQNSFKHCILFVSMRVSKYNFINVFL